MNKLWGAFIGAVFLVLIGSSVMLVDTDEVAIIYQFGAINRVSTSGLSFRLPAPIEHDERLEVTKIRTIELERIRLLTADVNLVELKPVAQYTIKDPAQYVISHAEPELVLQQLVQAVMMTILGRSNIHPETFLNRAELQRRIGEQLKLDIKEMSLGIQLSAFELKELSAPAAVADAFNEVSSARGDKDTMILSAQSYASKLLPDTRGHSKGKIEFAHGESSRLKAVAMAKTTRFQSFLEEYEQMPSAIERHLIAKTWLNILPLATQVQSTKNTQVVWPPPAYSE
jgi:modulator of FtsH protease HflK